MPSQPWFRLYHEFASDPVIQSLAFEDQRHFVVILCLKCSGVLDRRIEARARTRIILRGLGLDLAAAEEARRRLFEVGLIDKSWQPIGWDKRQFASDYSTPRVRKYRKNIESGNVPETPIDNRFRNAPETETETETETEDLGGSDRGGGAGGGEGVDPGPEITARAGGARQNPRALRGSRLRHETLPAEWERWARAELRERGGGIHVAREWQKFADHWAAQSGQRGVKLDWLATWRNWIRRALEQQENRNGRRTLSAVERVERANDGPGYGDHGRAHREPLETSGEDVRPPLDGELLRR